MPMSLCWSRAACTSSFVCTRNFLSTLLLGVLISAPDKRTAKANQGNRVPPQGNRFPLVRKARGV